MAVSVLLQATYTYLKQDTVLQALLTGIYDEIPENEQFPYLYMGDSTEIPLDGYNQTRRTITLTLHVWSQAVSMEEIETIMGQLSLLLHHQTLPDTTGYVCISCEREFETTFRESDGITRHGTQRFRFLLEKNGNDY